MRRNILIPIIGCLTGSLSYILIKDIIEIVKKKRSIKQINYNLKRLINSGLIIGGLMGSLILIDEKRVENTEIIKNIYNDIMKNNNNLKEINNDIIETIKETKINNSNFSYDAIKEIIESTC